MAELSSNTGNFRTVGSMYAPGFYYTSDRRLKTGIKKIENALDLVKKLE